MKQTIEKSALYRPVEDMRLQEGERHWFHLLIDA